MTYAVIWSMEAIRQLARIEAAADDPVRVRRAGELVDFALRRVPLDL